MPQSLSRILVHIIFSTKQRLPLLKDDIHLELRRYMATVLKEHESPAIEIGGVADHVHILCVLSKNYPVCKIVEEAKKSTSKWLKTRGDWLAQFQWQNGYGAFSVSQSHEAEVQRYIQDQKEHHRKMSFQDEFRRFLDKYRVAYDERYVWD